MKVIKSDKRKSRFMRSSIAVLVTMVLFFSLPDRAVAKYGGAFLEVGTGARAVAMGGAYTAMGQDGFMFYWNPAGLATLRNLNISFQHAKLFNGLENHNVFSITRPIFGGNFISLSWIRLSVPNVPRYESDNLDIYGPNGWSRRMQEAQGTLDELINQGLVLTDPALGYTNFTNDAIYLSFSKMKFFNVDFGWQYFVLPVEMPMGVSFKIIRQNLFDFKASGIGMDLGWMLRFGFNDLFDKEYLGKIAVGVALKDVWQTKISWDNDTRHSDIIQRALAVGVSYWQPLKELNSSLTVSYDYHRKYDGTHHLGLEYEFNKKLGIRFGMNDGNFTMGAGLKLWIMQIDYAYVGQELGNTHRIGINLGF